MRPGLPFLALAALILAACSQAGGEGEAVREFDGNGVEVSPRPRIAIQQGTAVIDQARILAAADKASLEKRTAEVAGMIGRKLTVVLLRPVEGQSLEQVAWAIAPAAGADRPLMLVVDVASGSVRVDGLDDPAQAAAIARAIGPELKAGQVAPGVGRGLDQVAAFGRSGA